MASWGLFWDLKLGPLLETMNSLLPTHRHSFFSGEGSVVGGLIGLGILGYLKYTEQRKQQLAKPEERMEQVLPHQRVGDIVMIAAVSGILGAKIFSNFEEPNGWKNFFQDPMGNFFSGLTIYGGLILGAASVIWFATRKKINVLHLGDAIAPALILAYGIGRIGCQVAGDGDWGVYNAAYATNADGSIVLAEEGQFEQVLATYPKYFEYAFEGMDEVPYRSFKAPSFIPQSWVAQNYAHNVNGDGLPLPDCTGPHCSVLPIPVFPTPIYEIVMSLIIFGILIWMSRRIAIPGVIFASYIFFNGLERFWIEKIRVNNVLTFAGMKASQAEFISVGFMVFGLLFLLWCVRKHKRQIAR
jgi:phosphatidylglycerol:prolipoprotein diacylglycerol transferase